MPRGAFYAFPNIRAFKKSSDQFAKLLLKEARVITVPGSMFGSSGEGYIRLSYTAPYPKLEEALDSTERVAKRLKHT